MKQYDKIKTVQLLIYIALTVFGLAYIFTHENLYHLIATNPEVKIFFGILWIILGISFLFMFFDFSSYSTLKREYSELDLAIFSDPVTGMANRTNCDAYIEQFLDKPLPEGVGCITFDIINLGEINKKYGHLAGNNAIREFSNALQAAAANVCFVGRNGGNKFLAIFQNCTEEKINGFLEKVEKNMEQIRSKEEKGKADYRYGIAFHEGDSVKSINELIALSNRRAIESYRTFVDR